MASGAAQVADTEKSGKDASRSSAQRSEGESGVPAPWLLWIRSKVTSERMAVGLVLLAGALLFFPFLGSLGLWDPWETHYGEVAREMIARDDYVYPYWESAYFFSKPALPMWLMALGLLLTRSENPDLPESPLGPLADWGMRVPFALIAILCMWGVYRIARDLKDRSAGLVAAFVLATSAQFIFIGKQAMVDMPLVGFMTAGLALFMAAVFDREEDGPASRSLKIATVAGIVAALAPQLFMIGRELKASRDFALLAVAGVVGLAYLVAIALRASRQQCWLAGFYVLMGLAALAKGLAPLAIVGPVVILYALMTGDLGVFFRARVVSGGLLFLLIASPWYVTLSLFGGRDDEGKTFVERFWMHDNFGRVGQGVHGDRGGLAYFIEQLAYGTFPWIALLPSALGHAVRRLDQGEEGQRARGLFFVVLWAAWSYVFFSMSLTKFHHYIFPAVPAIAVLVACWLVYVAEDTEARVSTFAATLIAVVFVVAARDLLTEPQNLVNLFTYKYDRDYPRELNPARYMMPIILGGGAITLWYWAPRGFLRAVTVPVAAVAGLFGRRVSKTLRLDRPWAQIEASSLRPQRDRAILAYGAMAAAFGIWISHHHFNMLSPHWSQAHLFKTYYQERVGNEPIYAYQLNWRGETFYSRNRILQVKENGANERMRELVDRPGREFIITEQSRYHTLQSILSPDKREKIRILDRSNNKFYLCVVDE